MTSYTAAANRCIHMGAESGDTGSEVVMAVSGQPEPSFTRGEHVRSRSSHAVVYLAESATAESVYHTSRLCPEYPVPAESVRRTEAEDDGHTFCWSCFELEMRALAQD